jgi:hypothetical protein
MDPIATHTSSALPEVGCYELRVGGINSLIFERTLEGKYPKLSVETVFPVRTSDTSACPLWAYEYSMSFR